MMKPKRLISIRTFPWTEVMFICGHGAGSTGPCSCLVRTVLTFISVSTVFINSDHMGFASNIKKVNH